MKNIIIITNEISRRGGIEEVTRQVKNIFEIASDYKVEVIFFPQNNFSELLLKAKLLLKSNEDNILMFMHPFILHSFNKIWLSLYKGKIICWAYGIDVWGNYGKEHSKNFIETDLIIAISEFTKKQVLENYPTLNINVVNLGVDEQLIKNIDNNTKEKFEILTVGRLSSNEKYKGHDLVIQALINLRNKGFDDIIYHVVGSGNDQERLKKIVNENNLNNNIIFHGYVSDDIIYEIYNKCSVFVMPSQVIKRDKLIWGGEGFGLVYLEAALYQLPVIATNEGGQTDCIIDGQTGFLIGNILDLENRIQYFYENNEKVIEMGKNARKYVLNRFTINHFSYRLLDSIQSVF